MRRKNYLQEEKGTPREYERNEIKKEIWRHKTQKWSKLLKTRTKTAVARNYIEEIHKARVTRNFTKESLI